MPHQAALSKQYKWGPTLGCMRAWSLSNGNSVTSSRSTREKPDASPNCMIEATQAGTDSGVHDCPEPMFKTLWNASGRMIFWHRFAPHL
jgi:hypothetical protein